MAVPERDVSSSVGSTPAIELRKVTRAFAAQPALVGVDVTIQRGEAVLVWGSNGAGKSTLLRLIATAIGPTFGTGRVLGYDLVRDRRAIRAATELLGHRTRLYEELTPREYLRFVARLYGIDAARVGPAISAMHLEHVADRPARELSQGSRQRVALARTFLREPPLLLLDEPYASLDESARSAVDGLLRTALAWGTTVVLATHDLDHALEVVHRSIRLEGGRVVDDGTGSARPARVALGTSS